MKCYLEAMQLGALDYLERPLAQVRHGIIGLSDLCLPHRRKSSVCSPRVQKRDVVQT
jgi:hypothetical protein